MVVLFGLLVQAKADDVIIKGYVRDDSGAGIEGVVVNNGYAFVTTGKNGEWTLPTDTLASKYIEISTPKEFHLPAVQGLASGFYLPVRAAAHSQENIFTLKPRADVSDHFHYIVISDPQVRTASDMKRWRQETVTDVMRRAAELKKTGEVVTMTLGDLVFDNMKLMAEYKTSMKNDGRTTVFQCIGNHDFNKTYGDAGNMPKGSVQYAERTYCDNFGPMNYSFNIGRVHIVTIKNINYKGNHKYDEMISAVDMEWLKKDLSYVPDSITVLLNMHAPGWNKMETQDNIDNAQELAEVLAGHNVHVFCGHTHFFENVEVTPTLYQHNIAAACGAWWKGNLNRCGAPNGYMTVEMNGNDISWIYKGTGLAADYQMRVYRPGSFRTQKAFVVANIWDWDPHCHVAWYQDGKYMGKMIQMTDDDEAFIRNNPLKPQMCKTQHLFKAKPLGRYNKITIVLTNRFGKKYSYTMTNERSRPAITDIRLPQSKK